MISRLRDAPRNSPSPSRHHAFVFFFFFFLLHLLPSFFTTPLHHLSSLTPFISTTKHLINTHITISSTSLKPLLYCIFVTIKSAPLDFKPHQEYCVLYLPSNGLSSPCRASVRVLLMCPVACWTPMVFPVLMACPRDGPTIRTLMRESNTTSSCDFSNTHQ